MVAWQDIPWKHIHRHVFHLQKRISRSTQRGAVRTAHKLQKLLLKSWYARLLAVRRVTQDNRGKHTAGIDGVKSVPPPQRLTLATELRLDDQATPLRRTWIPKPGSQDKRPLGIPTVEDRPLQRAVAGIVSAIYEPDFLDCSFGYRPGRNPHMALKVLRDHIVTGKVRHVYEADIEGYFTHLNHEWLRKMIALRIADPVITGLIGKWLNAGVMEHGVIARPEAGTPQGGPLAPLLALIALHEMDTAITTIYPGACVIAYADDCVVLHEDRTVLEHSQQLLMMWLAGMGLTLNAAKSRISHTLEGAQAGLDFLGFHIRQYRVGTHQSGKRPRGRQRLGFKTLITPAKANIKEHLAELGRIIRRGKDLPQEVLISQLNPKIQGWA
jgi:RNA-directed DNA polymerase